MHSGPVGIYSSRDKVNSFSVFGEILIFLTLISLKIWNFLIFKAANDL